MNWLAVTGFCLFLCLLGYSEAYGQASSSIRLTIVVHECESAHEVGDTGSKTTSLSSGRLQDQRNTFRDAKPLSSEVSLYLDAGEVVNTIGSGGMTRDDNALEEVQAYLNQAEDLPPVYNEPVEEGVSSSIMTNDESGDYRVIMEYN